MRVYEKESLELLKWKRVSSHIGIPNILSDLSPFRYPGGKGKLARFLAYFLVSNDLVGTRLIEPFCGGAGGTLPLLEADLIDSLILNDLNPAIFSFWLALKNSPDELIRLINSEPVNIDAWRYWRNIYLDDNADSVERGFAAFFLNRTNRSGILHAGPIGGQDQSGAYKIDCRFNRLTLSKRVEKISSFADRIEVYSEDASKILSDVVQPFDFVYADPPYVKEGKNIYKNFAFDDKSHFNFSVAIKRSNAKWLISYDDHPLVHSLYAKAGINVIEFSYMMNQARLGRELLIASSRLTLPVIPERKSKSSTSFKMMCV